MSNFDPITYSAVNKLKPEIGTMILVPDGFISDKYISAGSEYNSADFPLMSAAYPAGSVNVVSSSATVPTSVANTSTPLGTAIGCYNTGVADEYYVIFSNGDIYKIAGTSAPVFYKQLLDPADALAAINVQFLSDSLNDRVYVTTSTQTYYIDIMADFATVAVTFPGTFAPLHNTTLTNRPGINMQFLGGKYFTVGKLTPAATSLTVVTSTDGVTFIAEGTIPNLGTNLSQLLTGNTTVLFTTSNSTSYSSTNLTTWTLRDFSGPAGVTIAGYVKNTNTWIANYSSVTGFSTDNIGWTAKTPNFVGATRFISTNDAVLAVYNSGSTVFEINNATTWAVGKIPTEPFNSANGGFTWLVSNNASSVSSKLHCLQLPHTGTAAGAVVHKMYDLVLGQTSITNNYEKCYTRANINTTSYNQPVFLNDGLVGVMFDTTAFVTGLSALRGVRTADGGATWTPFTINVPPAIFISRFVQCVTDGTKFIVHSINNWQQFGISSNSGAHNLAMSTDGSSWTWSTNTTYQSSLGWDSVLLPAAAGSMVLHNSNGSSSMYTANSGDSWTASTSFNCVHRISDGAHAYLINPTTSSVKWTGTSWEVFSFPANASYSSTGVRVGATKFAVLINSTTTMFVYSRTDNIWTKITSPVAFAADSICSFHGDTFLIYNSGNLYYTTNCVNWSVKKNTAFTTLNKKFISGTSLLTNVVSASTDPNIRLFPPIVSSVVGAKWAIRAKK